MSLLDSSSLPRAVWDERSRCCLIRLSSSLGLPAVTRGELGRAGEGQAARGEEEEEMVPTQEKVGSLEKGFHNQFFSVVLLFCFS